MALVNMILLLVVPAIVRHLVLVAHSLRQITVQKDVAIAKGQGSVSTQLAPLDSVSVGVLDTYIPML